MGSFEDTHSSSSVDGDASEDSLSTTTQVTYDPWNDSSNNDGGVEVQDDEMADEPTDKTESTIQPPQEHPEHTAVLQQDDAMAGESTEHRSEPIHTHDKKSTDPVVLQHGEYSCSYHLSYLLNLFISNSISSFIHTSYLIFRYNRYYHNVHHRVTIPNGRSTSVYRDRIISRPSRRSDSESTANIGTGSREW